MYQHVLTALVQRTAGSHAGLLGAAMDAVRDAVPSVVPGSESSEHLDGQ